jgi:hypothetical protein
MLGIGLQVGLPWLYAIDPRRIGITALTILLLNFHVEFLICIFPMFIYFHIGDTFFPW